MAEGPSKAKRQPFAFPVAVFQRVEEKRFADM